MVSQTLQTSAVKSNVPYRLPFCTLSATPHRLKCLKSRIEQFLFNRFDSRTFQNARRASVCEGN